MADERHEGRDDALVSTPPGVLTPLVPAGEGSDTTTLEHTLATWHRRRALLTAYIRAHLQEGIDYYTLTRGGKVAKPSLSKAGSEKFLQLFRVHPRFRQDEETWVMLGRPAGVICYVCTLHTADGTCVGEGRGARDVGQEHDINKAIKMAQKSAQIDAVLRLGALSDAFTQDLEDQRDPEAVTVRQQKHQIVALLARLGIGPLDKAGYAEVVQQYTGLALVPALYPDIIHRLEEQLTQRRPPRVPTEATPSGNA
jgi:hypothetical protein